MMPPLTGLGIGRIVIFYIYAAPTALLAEILRLRNVQTPEFGNPEGSRIPKRFRLKAPGNPRNKRQRRGLPGVAGRNFRNLKEVALGGAAAPPHSTPLGQALAPDCSAFSVVESFLRR